MFIILEGPDGSGKTRLAGILNEMIKREEPDSVVKYVKKSVPERHPLLEYEDVSEVLLYRPNTGIHVICDRFHWGERVYPTVRNRPTQLDEPAWRHINATLSSRGALVVICNQYADVYPEVYRSRGEDMAQLDELPRVQKHFRELEFTTPLFTTSFNWQSPMNGDATRILEVARRLDRSVTPLSDFTTYVGSSRPIYLLVGDVRHGVDPSTDGGRADLTPAFVPHLGTSGHYLLDALPPVIADDFGVVNACDVDDVSALHRALGEPMTVTLGRNAHKATPFAHGQVPHPQFVRRFHHDKKYAYGALIENALTTRRDYSRWPS